MPLYDTILVGIDFDPLSEVALNAAAALAERPGARKLHLVHVEPLLQHADASMISPDGVAQAFEKTLQDGRARLAAYPVPKTIAAVTNATRIGSPARELVEEAQDRRADLIVVASHDRGGMSRVVLGSVASTLVRVSSCPVMIVGPDRPGTLPIRRVLAAIDLSPISGRVLAEAARVAAALKAQLTVLSLYEIPLVLNGRPLPIAIPKTVEGLEASYRARVEKLVGAVKTPGLEIRTEVMRKAPAHNAILEVSELLPADLIIVGTSGHNAWHRFFLGATATRVACTAHCPVMIVPHA